ncbi:hypothetical protein GCM10009544_22860 [Streptomyces stramineus]|uniref:Uncharacterized protein n=1 Tax=Streptomyces stramineus TaxID=173861 RepID=A0ABP3JNT0_9ACTN
MGGAAAGTGVRSPSASVAVIHASYISYGTMFTSDAALMTPSCPWGTPPLVCTPLEPGLSDAWRAPVTETWPVGGAGILAVSALEFASPGSQPRTTGRALPPSVRSRIRT